MTNPLLEAQTLNEAIEFYLKNKNKYDSVFSVTGYQSRFYFKNGEPVNHNPAELIRTQDLVPLFEENSNFYIFSKESFLKTNSRIGEKPFMFELIKTEAIDIDDLYDYIRDKGVIGGKITGAGGGGFLLAIVKNKETKQKLMHSLYPNYICLDVKIVDKGTELLWKNF